jgi:excisionase family DNA binding protein
MTTDISKNDTFSTSDVAILLNVHKSTIRRWTKNGILLARRVGPRQDRLFTHEDVYRFLDNQK